VKTVRLDAANRWGKCWNTNEITVLPLVASFTANQTSGLSPLTIAFTDTSTDQPTSWYWNFGDGGISNLQNPVYTYKNAGVYIAYLNATNGYDGWMSAQPTTITIYSLPLVSFMASPTTGMTNTSVKFNDQSTGFPSPASWYWDFGDGFNSTQQNPSHQYTIPGSYTVNHSATNTQGTVWLNKTAYISIS
jgi:PKD repeat protein